MVRVNKEQLIVVIHCPTVSPLETLSHLQAGLRNFISAVDVEQKGNSEVSHGLYELKYLLDALSLDELQMRAVNKAIGQSQELQNHFNLKSEL